MCNILLKTPRAFTHIEPIPSHCDPDNAFMADVGNLSFIAPSM